MPLLQWVAMPDQPHFPPPHPQLSLVLSQCQPPISELIPPALQDLEPALPCTALESGWHHMALQPAFWGLAWRKDMHTQVSVWLGLLVLLLLLTTSLLPFLWINSTESQSQQCPHTSMEHGPSSSPQSLLRFRVWVCLAWAHQSALGNTSHPPPHPHLLSLTHCTVLSLRQCFQDNSWLVFVALCKYLSLFCVQNFTWSMGLKRLIIQREGVTEEINQSNWNHLLRPHILSAGWYQQRSALTVHITVCTLPRICSNITHYRGKNVSSWE